MQGFWDWWLRNSDISAIRTKLLMRKQGQFVTKSCLHGQSGAPEPSFARGGHYYRRAGSGRPPRLTSGVGGRHILQGGWCPLVRRWMKSRLPFSILIVIILLVPSIVATSTSAVSVGGLWIPVGSPVFSQQGGNTDFQTTYTSSFNVTTTGTVLLIVHSVLGQTVTASTGTLTIAALGNGTANLLVPGLAPGSYAGTFSATLNGTPISPTSAASFTVPQPSEYGLSIQVDRTSYTANAQIVVNGSVSPPPSAITNVAITVKNPVGAVVAVASSPVSTSTGSYSSGLATGSLSCGWITGTYMVIGVWNSLGQTANATTNFTFAQPTGQGTATTTSPSTCASQYGLTVQTGHVTYLGDATIPINGSVSPTPIASSNVTITVRNPVGIVVASASSPVSTATGAYSTSISAGSCPSADWFSGTYDVVAVWEGEGQTANASASFGYVVPVVSVGLVSTCVGGPENWSLASPPIYCVDAHPNGCFVTPGMIYANFRNNLDSNVTGIVLWVVHNEVGQTVGIGSTTLQLSAGANATANPIIYNLAPGTYNSTVFAIASNGVEISTSTVLLFTLPGQ